MVVVLVDLSVVIITFIGNDVSFDDLTYTSTKYALIRAFGFDGEYGK
jgi:hypothetical protein